MKGNDLQGVGIDRIFALFGLIGGSALITFVFVKGSDPLYLVLGAGIFLACAIWIVKGRSVSTGELVPRVELKRTTLLLLSVLFFMFLTASVIALYLRPEVYARPMAYFILTGAMFGLIGIEALGVRGRWTYMIMVQLVIVGLSLAWSQMTIFPGW